MSYCIHHPHKEATYIIERSRTLLCDECAETAQSNEVEVRQIKGWLWGCPIVVQRDPLEEEFISDT